MSLTHSWQDLHLPSGTMNQLRAIYDRLRGGPAGSVATNAPMQPVAHGHAILFSGSDGAGKTQAAAVLARELGLDLYRIDLNGIVSQYIGETEKNLDRIFTSAPSSSVLLFFDEGDALFGKRSDVRDSHDRYANADVSYLLQKIEAQAHLVILATNRKSNVDQAFLRRFAFTVDFPARPG